MLRKPHRQRTDIDSHSCIHSFINQNLAEDLLSARLCELRKPNQHSFSSSQEVQKEEVQKDM